jgi:hypothetical protein
MDGPAAPISRHLSAAASSVGLDKLRADRKYSRTQSHLVCSLPRVPSLLPWTGANLTADHQDDPPSFSPVRKFRQTFSSDRRAAQTSALQSAVFGGGCEREEGGELNAAFRSSLARCAGRGRCHGCPIASRRSNQDHSNRAVSRSLAHSAPRSADCKHNEFAKGAFCHVRVRIA